MTARKATTRKFIVINGYTNDYETVSGNLQDVARVIEAWGADDGWTEDDVNGYVRVFEYTAELKVVGENKGVSAYFPGTV